MRHLIYLLIIALIVPYISFALDIHPTALVGTFGVWESLIDYKYLYGRVGFDFTQLLTLNLEAGFISYNRDYIFISAGFGPQLYFVKDREPVDFYIFTTFNIDFAYIYPIICMEWDDTVSNRFHIRLGPGLEFNVNRYISPFMDYYLIHSRPLSTDRRYSDIVTTFGLEGGVRFSF